MKKVLITLVALGALVSSPVFAVGSDGGELVIKDCTGMVRAASQIAPGSINHVAIRLTQTSGAAINITLSAAEGSNSVMAEAKDGIARLEDLRGGQWTACLDRKDVSIDSVSIDSVSAIISASESSDSNYALLGGGFLGSGLAIAGLSSSGSSHSGTSNELIGGGSFSIDNAPAVASPGSFQAS